MWEPSQPIEGSRPDRFRPPHCPWPECPDHTRVDSGYRAARKGGYRRASDPHRRVPRFRCPTCKRQFSRSTFTTTYYLKRPALLRQAAKLLNEGCAHRQIARVVGCAPSTITRLSARLGRHARLLQQQALDRIDEITEPVVLDHFETFVRSQVERLAIATPVGQSSWFSYTKAGARYLSPNRRAWRKRPLERVPERPPPGEVTRSVEKALKPLIERSRSTFHLISDDHPSYPRAIRKLQAGVPVLHAVYPNPDRSPGSDRSTARRRDREMFAVDLEHKLMRHGLANHKRETISVGRKVSNVLGRAALFAVWRNFVKGVSERDGRSPTPAMRLGLTSRRWSWTDVLAQRLFDVRVGRAIV